MTKATTQRKHSPNAIVMMVMTAMAIGALLASALPG